MIPAWLSSARRKRPATMAVIALSIVALLWTAAEVELGPGARGGWLRVEERDLVLGIPAEGELRAVDSALIGPPQLRRVWNFQISMIAPEGSEVVAGQPVLGFDTTELNQRLRQSMAEADATEKELEKAVTDFEIERRRLDLRIEEARAQLRQAELKVAASADLMAAIELEKASIDRRLAATEIAGYLSDHGIDHGVAYAGALEKEVSVIEVSMVKGLELDAAIVVEPDAIVEYEPQGMRSLYVAITRATRRLTIIDTGDRATVLR